MGYTFFRIDGGPHQGTLQLSSHLRPMESLAESVQKRQGGAVIGFHEAAPGMERKSALFLEFSHTLPVGFELHSRRQQLKRYTDRRQTILDSVNLLLIADSQGHRTDMSPLQQLIADRKPDLLFPDIFETSALATEFDHSIQDHEGLSKGIMVASVAAGGAATIVSGAKYFKKVGGVNEKGRRKKTEALRISRRTVLKRLGLTLVGMVFGLGAGHELNPNRSWAGVQISKPGEISGYRELFRKLRISYTHGLPGQQLREAIVAEKISRICKNLYGSRPADVGIVFGAAHGGLKEMLESPGLRKQVIQSESHLHERFNPEFTGQCIRLQFNPKTSLYQMEDTHVGFQ
ncbi:hypothetical protein HY994_06750 [Candidatus Micrarchaeota archaeon]|nr:hypothetical protein [Candidatus Micrarchaeota archaeon]